jgi:hypothetical protein
LQVLLLPSIVVELLQSIANKPASNQRRFGSTMNKPPQASSRIEKDPLLKIRKDIQLPPLVRYQRLLADRLPLLNANGQLAYKSTESTGAAAIKELSDPKNILSDGAINNLKKTRCPNFPFMDVPNPEALARKVLVENQGNITPEVRQYAADFFRIPEGTRMMFIGPEYFCRDQLLHNPKFQVRDSGSVLTGVKPCCPWCKVNIGVCFKSWECKNVKTMPRSIVTTNASRMPLFGVRYWCGNNECAGKVQAGEDVGDGIVLVHDKNGKQKLDKDGLLLVWNRQQELTKKHSFVIWNKDCFSQFPPAVRKRFSRFVFGLAEDDEPQNLPSPHLALEVLDTSKTFSSIEDSLHLAFELIQETAVAAYYSFVDNYGQQFTAKTDIVSLLMKQPITDEPPKVKWPHFDKDKLEKEFGPPKVDAIETIFWVCYNMIKPYLDRDLCSRIPGRLLRWDGTYKAAKKMIMIDAPELNSINVILLVFGEYGDIQFWGAAEDEGPSNWQVAHFLVMKRCERMGAKALLDVVNGYDDLGSGNLKKPTDHWFATIWRNVSRAPRKDPFHGVQLVTKSTYGSSHPLHQWFCQKLTGCLMNFVSEDDMYTTEHKNIWTSIPAPPWMWQGIRLSQMTVGNLKFAMKPCPFIFKREW